MNSWRLITAFVAVFGFCAAASTAHAESKSGGCQSARHEGTNKSATPICPVMDGPIDFSVRVATRDGPVYFCCKDCLKKHQARPKKYTIKVAEQRKAMAALPKVQVTCPVSGKTVDEKVSIEHDGRKVYFCCKDCVSKFKRNPAKYKAGLAGSYAYQTKCPVMGGDIDPAAFATLPDGKKVFFCCPGCDKKFLKDPAKYAAQPDAQGIKIDPDAIKVGNKGEHGEHEDRGSHNHGGRDH